MTDQKLIAALRSVDHRSVEDCFLQSPLFSRAADRLENLAAALLHMGGVRVKPLEWEPVHGEGVETYQATCAIGIYRVFDDEDSAAGAVFVELAVDVSRFCMTDALSIGRVHDFDTAKAAAQADYERRILSALSPAPVGVTDDANGAMTPEEIRLENLKQMAAYDGPVVSFEFQEPYYLASCDQCGWVGSSEHCGNDSWGDDSDVHCPRCFASGADCGKVAAALASHEPASGDTQERLSVTGEAEGWYFSINYGPDGEADWANLSTPKGEHVANIRIHHARAIVAGMDALTAWQQEVERLTQARDAWSETADNLENQRDLAEARNAELEELLHNALAAGLPDEVASPIRATLKGQSNE